MSSFFFPQGYLWGVDSGPPLDLHFAERRDKWCKSCTHRQSHGNRLISTERIRIIPFTCITTREATCQQSVFGLGASGGVTIKKRQMVDGPDGKIRMQRLVFHAAKNASSSSSSATGALADNSEGTNALLPSFSSFMSSEVLLVDHQEVGGTATSERYAVGTARVPPKHFGADSSVVCVFADEAAACRFDTLFVTFTAGTAPWRLQSGLERFIFDSKRASMAPYCSILTRVAGVTPCPCCAVCGSIVKKKPCLDSTANGSATAAGSTKMLTTGRPLSSHDDADGSAGSLPPLPSHGAAGEAIQIRTFLLDPAAPGAGQPSVPYSPPRAPSNQTIGASAALWLT